MANPLKKAIGIGNIHTHHFIGDYLPDSLVENQSGFKEKTIRSFPVAIMGFFKNWRIWPFRRLVRARDVNKIRKYHLKQMKKSGVDYSIPLMVDYSMSSPISRKEKLTKYRDILRQTTKSCAKNPFQFFPLHYFDPRYGIMQDLIIGKTEYEIPGDPNGKKVPQTTSAIRLLLDAYFKYGVVGIKLYPAHGYHPIPMGGRTHDPDDGELSEKWRKDILNLIKKHKGILYTDNSFEIITFLSKDEIKDKNERRKKLKENLKKFKTTLQNEDYSPFIIFGTDWPLGLTMYSEKKYTKTYMDELEDDIHLYNRYLAENLAVFLFGEDKVIPQNHIRFLKRTYGETLPEKPWVPKPESTPDGIVYKVQNF